MDIFHHISEISMVLFQMKIALSIVRNSLLKKLWNKIVIIVNRKKTVSDNNKSHKIFCYNLTII